MRIPPPWPVVLMTRSLDLGGSERQVAEVAMSLDPRQFRASVACFDSTGIRADDLRRAGVPVVEFAVRSFRAVRTPALAWQFMSWLRREQVALVHPFDGPTALFGVPFARLARVPVVLSSQRGDRRLSSRGYQRALMLTDHLVDTIVVNSNYVRGLLGTDSNVPAARIHTCRNGLDTTIFHPGGRAPDAGDGGGLVVGIVAALRLEKSIETLVEAFARLGHRSHSLTIVGDGPCKGTLETLARSLGVLDRTTFTATTSDVTSWYRRIDVFVLPSINESFSNSLMEAMACGCAVVASKVGGNPELVVHGDNGLLFEPRNVADLTSQLEIVLGDAALRHRLSAAAIRTIEQGYTRERSARCFGELYERLLSSERLG
jgi:glycosyltransferase involved in cell wall biosynthesis